MPTNPVTHIDFGNISNINCSQVIFTLKLIGCFMDSNNEMFNHPVQNIFTNFLFKYVFDQITCLEFFEKVLNMIF